MESRKQLRTRIAATKSAQQFTRAMKLLSATKIRKATDAIVRFRPYADRMATLVASLHDVIEEGAYRHYFTARPPERVAIVLVTSDRGLCGGFNASVVRRAIALLEGPYAAQHARGDVVLLCVGRKGVSLLKRSGYTGNPQFVDIQRVSSVRGAFDVGAHLTALFERGELDRVEIVYHRFKNVATQVLTHEVLLPVQPAPAPGPGEDETWLFEPSEHDVLTAIVPRIVEVQLYRALLESQAAEQGARMLAMDKANENAEELLHTLKLAYNQARQAAITREIAEIIGGRLKGEDA
jgi:F-type H+-transporting ATPase subunit gamma